MTIGMSEQRSQSGPGPRSARDEAVEIVTRLPLFLSSYAPLFVIFAVRFDSPSWVRPASIALAGLGLFFTLTIARTIKKIPSSKITVKSVKDAGAETGGYLATYVLPFVPISTPSNADMIGYGIFLVVLALVYVRSELVQVNPIAYLLLLRVVKVTPVAGEEVYVIARQRPRMGEEISVRSFAGVRVRTTRGSS